MDFWNDEIMFVLRKGGGGWASTFSVKFGIYMYQVTIFRGVLGNCPTYFLSPYYYLIS
jgi:hypothetical protein